MGLKDVGSSLPPGFRFYPNDEELVLHYLYKKITNEDVLKGTLVEVDLHTCEPWQLPEVAKVNATEWYFFSFRDRKYATGYRTNRATTSGYWKATGKDRTVLDPITGEIVGMRKTLVFYMNRAPNGIKTGWIMHEFRLETPHMPPKEDWVLCRVFHKGNEDNSTKLIPQQPIMYIENNNISPPSLTLANSSYSSPTNQTMTMMPLGYNQLSSPMPINNYHQSNHNNYLMDLFEFSRETTNTNNSSSVTQISPKGEDDGYGFLWDMDLEENTSFHDGVGVTSSSNLDGIRFQFDINNNNNNDNNSMVFL